jgi:HAD domain in Swiss Army Knife RNA repair proteins
MNVLFLDIDGVLNRFGDENGAGMTKETVEGTSLVGIDRNLLSIYKTILERVDPVVVLSSTWRVVPELRDHLRRTGVYFHDVTPVFDPSRLSRGHEIQAWLKECAEEPRYAIIDDDNDMLPEQKPNFFHTNGEDGLTQEIADKVAAHFGKEA